MHRNRLSRHRLRGTFLHRRLGDRILHKNLWSPTRESLARAWLVGWPITVIPLLPLQSLFAAIAALLVRGNMILCIALQFLSNPFTAPVHLSTCYLVGEMMRGNPPKNVWKDVKVKVNILTKTDELKDNWSHLLTMRDVTSLYLGAAVVGMVGGAIGYAVILGTWREKPRRRRETAAPFPMDEVGGDSPPEGPAQPAQLRLPLKTDEEKRAEARDGF